MELELGFYVEEAIYKIDGLYSAAAEIGVDVELEDILDILEDFAKKVTFRHRCSTCGKCRKPVHVTDSPIPGKPVFYLCQECYAGSFVN